MKDLIKSWADKISEQLGLQDQGTFLKIVSNGQGSSANCSARIVTFDTTQVRTTRDIIFILGHELTHIKQYRDRPAIISEGVRSPFDTMLMSEKEYRGLPREREADRIALELTRTLNYKNKVLNKEAPSIFVRCMENAPE